MPQNTNQKINIYRSLSPAEMRQQERVIAKFLFGMPKLEIPVPKGKVTFSVAESGFMSYRYGTEFGTKYAKKSLPKDESEAKKLAQEWMQKADEVLSKIHQLQQVNFPRLFTQFEFVSATPVTAPEMNHADYWSVTFQVFLQTGLRSDGKSNKTVPLQGSYMELMLGTAGRVIGMEYNHLPTIKSGTKSILPFFDIDDSKETEEDTGTTPDGIGTAGGTIS